MIEGSMVIEFEDGKVELNEGELYVVPKGVKCISRMRLVNAK